MATTKVAIFSSRNNPLGLENEVNTWLAQHPNLDIVTILQSQSGRLDMNITISIFYRTPLK